MGDTMEVELKFTDDIPLVASGKFRFVIQELKLPNRPAPESLEAHL